MTALPPLSELVELTVDDLADSLAGIAEQINVPVALGMAHHFGGTRLYVSSRWREELPVNVFGPTAAQDLCRMFGGESIDVPKCPWKPAAIMRIARELHARGLPVNDIARLLGLSWRTINKALSGQMPIAVQRKRRVDDRQIDIEHWLTRKTAAE
jgi:hypothetical protein